MKDLATIGFLATLAPGQFLFAQSSITVEDVHATVRLSANQSHCDWKHGPDCFDTLEFSADSMADFPLLAESEGNGPQGADLTGSASAMASHGADGLLIEQRVHGPGSECCGSEYFYFHAEAETEIRFNLAEAALVRFRKTSDLNFHDPFDMYTANGDRDYTLTNNTTGELLEEDLWNLSELALEAGDYTIRMYAYGWTSCNCSSTIAQEIMISDRPIPDQVVVEGHDTFVYHLLEGEDNYLDNTVREELQVDHLDDLPSYLSGMLAQHPEEGHEAWFARAASNALISPNRMTITSTSLAESAGWGDQHRRWNAQTYGDFGFNLTSPARVDINWCMDREEIIEWGNSVGSNTSRFRLFDTERNQIVLDMHLEALGSECESLQIELAPGRYVIWCDATARIDDPNGRMERSSRTEIDLVFNPLTPGDFNGDGQINGADLGILIAKWGTCDDCPEDLNHDGQVDGADLGLFIAYWTG